MVLERSVKAMKLSTCTTHVDKVSAQNVPDYLDRRPKRPGLPGSEPKTSRITWISRASCPKRPGFSCKISPFLPKASRIRWISTLFSCPERLTFAGFRSFFCPKRPGFTGFQHALFAQNVSGLLDLRVDPAQNVPGLLDFRTSFLPKTSWISWISHMRFSRPGTFWASAL